MAGLLPEKLLEGIPDAVLVIGEDGLAQFCNEAAKELFGSDLVGKSVGIPLKDFAVVQVPNKKGVRKLELRVADASDWRKGSKAVVLRDVTERESLEQGLQEKIYELDSLAELLTVMPIPVARVNSAGKIAWVNENFLKTFGKVSSLKEIPVLSSAPEKIDELFASGTGNKSAAVVSQVFDTGVSTDMPLVVRSVQLAVEKSAKRELHEYAILINTVDDSEEVLQAYMSLVFSDVALGLPNRRGLTLQAEEDWNEGKLEQSALVALAASSDSLEQDAVMTRVMTLIEKIWTDIQPPSLKDGIPRHEVPLRIGRLSANSLAVIFTVARDSDVGAADLAFSLARQLGIEVLDNVSTGVVADTRASDTLDLALDEAAFAAQFAQEHEQDTYSFQDNYNQVIKERQNLTAAVREAISKRAFTVVFQPRIDIKTEKIVSAEVLARFHDEKLGSVPPSDFIPVLRRLNLMTELTQIIGLKAIEELEGWQKAKLKPINLSLNIVPSDLSSSRALSVLRSLARKFSHPGKLELEMAETDPFPIASHGKLKSLLTELGLELSLDDFGTGYSSFSYLISLPISCVKIDKSFIDDILKPERKEAAIALIRSIVALSRELHISVCAEGVESQEQLEHLVMLGVDQVQGYIYSKPLEAKEFAEKYLS